MHFYRLPTMYVCCTNLSSNPIMLALSTVNKDLPYNTYSQAPILGGKKGISNLQQAAAKDPPIYRYKHACLPIFNIRFSLYSIRAEGRHITTQHPSSFRSIRGRYFFTAASISAFGSCCCCWLLLYCCCWPG